MQLITPHILDLINAQWQKNEDNVLYILFDIVQSLKKSDKTLFIIKIFENEIKAFLNGIQSFTEMHLDVNSKFFLKILKRLL